MAIPVLVFGSSFVQSVISALAGFAAGATVIDAVDNFSGITGLADAVIAASSGDYEPLKVLIGQIIAQQINAKYNTGFSSVYPVEIFVSELESEIVNLILAELDSV